MADIILKDHTGTHGKHTGIERLRVDTADGGMKEFVVSDLIPEIVENLPITLDFSGGDQTVVAPDGMAVKSAVIQKPADLIAENIAEGARIAGISGTLKAGGSPLPPGLYLESLNILPARSSNYGQAWYEWNGTLYAFVNSATGNAGINRVYKWNGSAWTQVSESSSNTNITGGNTTRFVEFNGKLHIFADQASYHSVFDGTTLTKCVSAPTSLYYVFVHNGTLMGMYYNGRTFSWDESTDTWTEIGTTSGMTSLVKVYEVNGTVYAVSTNALYTYDNLVLTQIATGSFERAWTVVDGHVYIIIKSNSYLYSLNEFDLATHQMTAIGQLPSMYNGRLMKYNGELAILNNCGGGSGQEAWLSKVHEVKSE